MNRTEEIKTLFEKLSWINVAEFARLLEMDRKNLLKYTSGKLEVSEKMYTRIMAGLKELKEQLP